MAPVAERRAERLKKIGWIPREGRGGGGGRILARIVDGKAKGCKWKRQEGRKEGTKAPRLRSIK